MTSLHCGFHEVSYGAGLSLSFNLDSTGRKWREPGLVVKRFTLMNISQGMFIYQFLYRHIYYKINSIAIAQQAPLLWARPTQL